MWRAWRSVGAELGARKRAAMAAVEFAEKMGKGVEEAKKAQRVVCAAIIAHNATSIE